MDAFDLIIVGFLVACGLGIVAELLGVVWIAYGDYQDAKKYATKAFNKYKNRRI